METPEWMAEAYAREKINEGFENVVYKDTMGIPTIGIGFNLTRSDAPALLEQVGADYTDVMDGHPLTDEQVEELFNITFAPVIDQARKSLQPTHFDAMSDARRFVLCDLVYNMGDDTWNEFTTTIGLIDQACHNMQTGDPAEGHRYFGLAADRLTVSTWASQVGNRARRDIAMLRTSNWVDPTGDGQ